MKLNPFIVKSVRKNKFLAQSGLNLKKNHIEDDDKSSFSVSVKHMKVKQTPSIFKGAKSNIAKSHSLSHLDSDSEQ